ncbi:DUF6924 domain-containing protein [Actinophytocola sp.]|uniref:DUF6924 domain-containing protein n=1 Tax=Actinophytocola sp. TaxID=1872138 RepID=UPI002D80494E|nr:hypothetical protein [Actinophytocola sp.]HET9141657.1 hypothetical protein [Actinophytocola sp.]
MATLLRGSVLVRTWFGDDAGWATLLREVGTPSEEGFLADVHPVSDPAFEGLSTDDLTARHAGGAITSFLADEKTFGHPEHPILAVWVYQVGADDPRDLRPFRVVPAALWGVENNINLGNMDWHEFRNATAEDGVFRGF